VAELPRGTVSLLFTDIEGSTQLQHRLQDRYREVVIEHRRLLEEAIESNGGLVVDRQTESFFAVFPRMRDAVAAAADAQRAIAAHEWPDDTQIKVRMGLHAGEPELEGDRYVGLAVARAARVGATAHGGQVLLSGAARGLLPERSRVRALGSYPLKDFDSPEPLFQLEVDGLPDRFPRPRVTPRRSRRRSLFLPAASALLLALVAGLAALLLGRSDGSGLALVHPNNVGVIDPQTNEIVGEVPVGIRPGPVAAGAGSIWVGNLEDRSLSRIDSPQRAVKATISLDRRTPTDDPYPDRSAS
jgi:class 3 adenylate cyclase